MIQAKGNHMAIVKPFVCIRPVEALAAQGAALP